MGVVVTINGTNRSSKLASLERRVEYCNPWQYFRAVFDSDFSVEPWESVVITEDGTLVFTGWTEGVDRADPGDAFTLTVTGADDIKRLRAYFVSEEYTTGVGTRVQYWINKFAVEAGCTIVFDEANDPVLPPDIPLGLATAWEIIDELLMFCGLDIWCDASNVVHVGFVMENVVTENIAASVNLVNMTREMDSASPRNACTVYGLAAARATYQEMFGWEIDAGDIRKMVVANPYIDNSGGAADLAYRMVQAAGPTYDIKRCNLNDVYEEMEVGDMATFNDGAGQSGQGNITSIRTNWEGKRGGDGRSMFVALDERCPRIAANGTSGSDVIVATYESGVWRCRDVFADYPHWEPLNNGLEEHVLYACSECPEPIDFGSSYKCDNIVRDPFNPEGHAYLLTEVGVYETHSLTSGCELWVPAFMNADAGLCVGVYNGYLSFGVLKLSANSQKRGEYHMVLSATFGGQDHTYFAAVYDDFGEIISGKDGGDGNYCGGHVPPECYLPIPQPNPPCNTPPSGCPKAISAKMWGSGYNYGHEQSVSMSSWHRSSGYITASNYGGLVSWSHPAYRGATASGVGSSRAANGEPFVWFTGVSENMGATLCGDDYEKAPTCTNKSYGWWYGIGAWVAFKQPGPSYALRVPELSAPWLHCSGIHVPDDCVYGPIPEEPIWPSEYDPDFEKDSFVGGGPALWWAIPGTMVGSPEITKAYPSRFHGGYYGGNLMAGACADYWPAHTGEKDSVIPPWGPSLIWSNYLSDSLGTFHSNCEYAYMFSGGSVSMFAYSNNAASGSNGGSWTAGCTVPHTTGAYAYDRRNYRILYCGRHAVHDSAFNVEDSDDRSVIWATRTRGTTAWHDASGDLPELTQALGLRQDVFGRDIGTAGIVAISPRW